MSLTSDHQIPNPYHVLRHHGLKPKKSLGQNFLVDPHMPLRIAQSGGIQPQDVVLEIGAGCGTLTHALAHYAQRVIALEYDEALIPIAQSELAYASHVDIWHQDIRHFNWHDFAQEVAQPIVVYGNLPYYLSTDILLALLEDNPYWTRACFLVQQEFADRVCARPGTRQAGSISALTHLLTYPSILFQVDAQCFSPPPKVTSAVMVLERRDTPSEDVGSMKTFRHVVRALFAQRRKMARRSLKAIASDPIVLLEQADIEVTRRGEDLSLAELASLSRIFHQQSLSY
jgi:16S rRNA (adenine1518-N6/adenine1519-N6)-dimethyltransferase